jgi:hypothetical protein
MYREIEDSGMYSEIEDSGMYSETEDSGMYSEIEESGMEGTVACTVKMKSVCRGLVGKPKGKIQLGIYM